MRALAVDVHVHNEEGSHAFHKGEVPPKWAAELITNPSVWEDGEVPEVTAPAAASDKPGAKKTGEVTGGTGDSGSPAVPPQVGAGSGTDAWAAYAKAVGFDLEPGVSKKDIIAGLDAAGIATKPVK